jgi:hypothetical protein
MPWNLEAYGQGMVKVAVVKLIAVKVIDVSRHKRSD